MSHKSFTTLYAPMDDGYDRMDDVIRDTKECVYSGTSFWNLYRMAMLILLAVPQSWVQ